MQSFIKLTKLTIEKQICNVRTIGLLKKTQLRFYSKSEPKCPSMKVTICGASGSIGQPLSLMLKQCPYIDELNLFDIIGACGVGLELSHVDTKCKVRAYTGKEQIKDSLKVRYNSYLFVFYIIIT